MELLRDMVKIASDTNSFPKRPPQLGRGTNCF